MLMRAYRRSYRMQGRDGRLSQSGLLDLMGRVDERYSELHGHSTVARWESGTTRPTRDRIEVFGQALNLSPAEIEGLMWLAGFERESAYPTRTQRLEESADTGSHARGSIKFPFSRLLLPASCVVVAGCVLAWLGWNATWSLIVNSQGDVVFFWEESHDPRPRRRRGSAKAE